MTDSTLTRDAALTPTSDKQGHEILICAPDWFDEAKTYKISNAPARTASLEFTGKDLNFMAKVLYAEASGRMQLPDKADRDKEKAAIMNVNHFRLNRKGYPSNAYIAKTFREVCVAPNQFETVFRDTAKYKNVNAAPQQLNKFECADLDEALEAIRVFMATGPTAAYQFDNFRGYKPGGQGTHIGRSRFWLSPAGQDMMKKAP
ncbi:hypothetical protein [Pseudoduganella sp.]|uniref:hypothetical protein n=1 Tax=Pseudoduganella sp. TaxID=1880898 RepID=UPI0035ADE185